jgi:hypothetical protein
MKKFAYLASLLMLGSGLMVAQTAKPESDSSNATQAQPQSKRTTSPAKTPGSSGSNSGAASGSDRTSPDSTAAPPDTTVRDQQSSTTDTTGTTRDSATQPQSTMGTTGNTPATKDQNPPKKHEGTLPSDGNGSAPVDQQRNSSSSPSPQARRATPDDAPLPTSSIVGDAVARTAFMTTAPQRAPHTPDPGTQMNPQALQNHSVPKVEF